MQTCLRSEMMLTGPAFVHQSCFHRATGTCISDSIPVPASLLLCLTLSRLYDRAEGRGAAPSGAEDWFDAGR